MRAGRALSADRTPIHPPAPTMLVPLDVGASVFRDFGVALDLLPPDAPADDRTLDALAERLRLLAAAGDRVAGMLPRGEAWSWPPRRLPPPPARPFDWSRDRWDR